MEIDLTEHVCDPRERYAINDARGIFLTFACPQCSYQRQQWLRATYRPEVLDDPQYWADEPIDPEDAQ